MIRATHDGTQNTTGLCREMSRVRVGASHFGSARSRNIASSIVSTCVYAVYCAVIAAPLWIEILLICLPLLLLCL